MWIACCRDDVSIFHFTVMLFFYILKYKMCLCLYTYVLFRTMLSSLVRDIWYLVNQIMCLWQMLVWHNDTKPRTLGKYIHLHWKYLIDIIQYNNGLEVCFTSFLPLHVLQVFIYTKYYCKLKYNISTYLFTIFKVFKTLLYLL